MGCDGSKVFKIAAKWSITSHRVAGPNVAVAKGDVALSNGPVDFRGLGP